MSSGSRIDRKNRKTGNGLIAFWKGTPGKTFLKNQDSTQQREVLTFLGEKSIRPVVQDGSDTYVQVYQGGRDRFVHVINYDWVGRQPLRPSSRSVPLSVPWSGEAKVKRVTISAPGSHGEEVPFTLEDGRVHFEAPIRINALATLEATR